MRYPFRCAVGHLSTVERPVEQASDPYTCTCGSPTERDYAVQFASQWIPPRLPRNLWTSWSDVHDRSEKELARDPNVVRYDPSMRHKPDVREPTIAELESLIRGIPDHEFEQAQNTKVDTSEAAVKG